MSWSRARWATSASSILSGEATVTPRGQGHRHDRRRRPLRRAGAARRRAPHGHGHGRHRPRPAGARPAPVPRPARGGAGAEPQDAGHPGRAGARGSTTTSTAERRAAAPQPAHRPGPRVDCSPAPRAASTFGVRMGSKFGTARKIILGIGIGFAIVTVASGLSGWVFSSVPGRPLDPDQREVFGGIPSALVVVFYIVVPILLIYGAVLFAQRTKNWERGRPDNRATTSANVKRRLRRLPRRRLHADPAARSGRGHHALAHLLQLPGAARRHHRLRDQPPAARPASSSCTAACTRATRSSATSAGLTLLIGVVWAMVRRYVAAALPHPHQDQARARGDPASRS